MKIHRDKFYQIIQEVINEYDENIKTTVAFMSPQSFFSRDLYADVFEIIKALLHKKEYIYDKYEYSEKTMEYIISFYDKTVLKICDFIYSQFAEFRKNNGKEKTSVSDLFELSEPKKLRLQNSVENIFNFSPATKN